MSPLLGNLACNPGMWLGIEPVTLWFTGSQSTELHQPGPKFLCFNYSWSPFSQRDLPGWGEGIYLRVPERRFLECKSNPLLEKNASITATQIAASVVSNILPLTVLCASRSAYYENFSCICLPQPVGCEVFVCRSYHLFIVVFLIAIIWKPSHHRIHFLSSFHPYAHGKAVNFLQY